MSTMRERPNRDALNDALDIFRDAMRPFIVRNMKRVRGGRVEDVIRESLPGKRADAFEQNLRDSGSVEDLIDVNDFPLIVQRNWKGVFDNEFDWNRSVWSALWLIADARNSAAHPGERDIDSEHVRARLYDITVVLGRINAPSEKREVENIRDKLFAPADDPTEDSDVLELRDEGDDTVGPRLLETQSRDIDRLLEVVKSQSGVLERQSKNQEKMIEIISHLTSVGAGSPGVIIKKQGEVMGEWRDRGDQSESVRMEPAAPLVEGPHRCPPLWGKNMI